VDPAARLIADVDERRADLICVGPTQKAKMGGWPTKAPVGYLNVREKVAGRRSPR